MPASFLAASITADTMEALGIHRVDCHPNELDFADAVDQVWN